MSRIFANPVLCQRFGVTWRIGNLLIAVGIALVVLGLLLLAILLRHVGARSRRLTPYEAGHVMFDQFHQHHMLDNATGVGIEASIDIPGFRAAAREGDWLKFWLWPICFTTWCLGIWAVIFGAAVALRGPEAGVVITVFVILMLFVCWFMPFAALYTKIDSAPPTDSPGSKP